MAKSKIISASIAVDIQNLQEVTGAVQGLSKDLSNIPIDKNLETRLKNVEKTVINVVKQISTMTDKIDVLSKAGGLDPKTLNDLSLLTTAISDVRIEVDALTTKVNNFSKGISDVGDIGIKKVSENISKEIGNMANNIDTSISNATVSIQKGGEKLKKTYEQLLQSVNAKVDVEGIDATKIFKFSDVDDVDAEFKKVKTKLQKDLKDLADATTNYNDLKIGGGSADDVAKAAKAQVNALNKLKESFEAFYGMEDLEDRVGENMTKGMTANINEVIKAFPNLQGEVYRTFDEMYDFIGAVMENISNDFTSSINTLKESLKSVSSEVEAPAKKSAAETKNKVKSVEKTAASGITTDVIIKEGVGAELIAELKTVIDNLQKYVDKNPVELNAVINPTWGTKQTQKYLKSIREQLSKTKDGKIDENLAARIYGLQDAFGKDFSDALNKSISKLKDSLQKEGFSVGKLKIEDTAIKDFREQISNEIGAITVDINANVLGTTIVNKDKQDIVNEQFEELKALGRFDPEKINNLVKTIKDTGADLDYSDIYKDRLKRIIKSLVDGVYGSVPEAIKKTRYPAGANPLIGEFNDNSARIKSITERIKEGAKGDALHYFNNQLKNLVERQKTILAELQQNVEGVNDATAESVKDAIQKIDVANIEVGNATINITNADATFSNITASTPDNQTPNSEKKTEIPDKVKEVSKVAEATLTATRDELIALANQRFKELVSSENIDFKGIESLVSDLRKIGVESINPKLTNNTVGRTVDAMLKGGYSSALEAFRSTTSHSTEAKAKALEAQQMSKFFERFQKLYTMQSVQEKGTGSEKSIQMFVDAVRKSGLNYKVADSYKNNEIGKLIDSMLTNNYKTVAEAIAARDNKPVEQSQNKNIEKAIINVTNLTIKGQQNIAEAKQKITSANIEIKKGNTTVGGEIKNEKTESTKTEGAKSESDNEKIENTKLQKLYEQYNQNIRNRDTMSLNQFLNKQEKILNQILAITNHKGTYGDFVSSSIDRNLSDEDKEYRNQLFERLRNIYDRDDIDVKKTIYQSMRDGTVFGERDPFEVAINISLENGKKKIRTVDTNLNNSSVDMVLPNAYDVESIHNHPNGVLLPSSKDILTYITAIDHKIKSARYEYSTKSFKDNFDDSAFKLLTQTITNNKDAELSIDFSKWLESKDLNNKLKELPYQYAAIDFLTNRQIANPSMFASYLNHVMDGNIKYTTYDENGNTTDVTSDVLTELSQEDISKFEKLVDVIKEFVSANNININDDAQLSTLKQYGKLIVKARDNNAIVNTTELKSHIPNNDHGVFGNNQFTFKSNIGSKGNLNDFEIYSGLANSYTTKLNELISSTTDEALKVNLENLRKELSYNETVLSTPLASNGAGNEEIAREAIQGIRQNINSIDEITSILSIKSKQIGVFLKNIKKIRDNIDDSEGLKLSASAQKTITDSKKDLDQLKLQLETAQKNNDYSTINEEEITQRILELKNATEDAIQKTVVDKIDVKGLIRKLDNLQIDEVKADPEVVSQVKTLRKTLQDAVDDDAREMLAEQYKAYSKQVSQLSGSVSKSDRTIFGNFMKELRHKNYQALAQFFSLNDILRYMREAVNVIKQYDSALIEMMKVSDETRASLERYQKTVFDTADAIGSSALTLNQATADWMRIGESLTEAAESAKAAQILMNVSEFQDINSATQALISASQAYADLDKMDIVDKINKLGNEFPIATDQLATALQNSAAALTTQGNSLDEALALVVGGNVITQDALKTGTGIRTIALRIAGTKEAKDELAELGEGVDDFVVRTESKTRKLIMDYTAVASNGFKGVDIYDDNGNLRSTYQILQDIADVYKEIQLEDRQAGTNRANALVELLAGKNRSNIAASILTNPDTIREAYEAAQNAEGSAMKENEKYLTSVDAHITKFKNAVDELINSLIDSGFINDVIDFGTTLVKLLQQITEGLGSVGTAFAAIGITAAFKGQALTKGGKGIANLVKTAFSSVGTVLTKTDVTNPDFDLSMLANNGLTKEAAEYLETLQGINEVEGAAPAILNAKAKADNIAAAAAAKHAAAMNLLKGGLVAAAVVIVTVLIAAYKKHQEEIEKNKKAVQELASESKKQIDTLKDYAKKIADARKVLEDERSSTEEIINAKNSLIDIQNELNDTYSEYNTIIKDINASIEEQNAALIRNAVLSNNEVLNNARTTETGDHGRMLDEEARLMLEHGTYTFGSIDSYGNVESILNKYAADLIWTNELDNQKYLTGDINKLDKITEVINILNNLDKSEFDDADIQRTIELLNNTKDFMQKNLEEYGDIYLAQGFDSSMRQYSTEFDKVMNDYYKHIEENTDETKEALETSILEIWEQASEDNNLASMYWIQNFFGNYSDVINKAILDSKLTQVMEDGVTTYGEELLRVASEVHNNNNKFKTIVNKATQALFGQDAFEDISNSTTPLIDRFINSLSQSILGKDIISDKVFETVSYQDALGYLEGTSEGKGISPQAIRRLNELQTLIGEMGLTAKEALDYLKEQGIFLDEARADLETQIAAARNRAIESGIMTGEQFDSLGIDTSDKLDAWEKKVEKTATSFEQASQMFNLAISGVDKTLDASTMLKNMEDQYKPVFDAMAEAYKAIWEDNKFGGTEKVSAEQIEAVRAQMEALSGKLKEAGSEGFETDDINEFILTLSDAEATEKEVQDAFNNLATVLVDSLNPELGAASAATAELIQKTLTDMGVTNAAEVTFGRLGYTLEQYNAAKEEADKNDLDLNASIGSLNDEELALIADSEALMTYYGSRVLVNSFDINTVDDVKALVNLAEALGLSTIGSLKLADAQKYLGQMMHFAQLAENAQTDKQRDYYNSLMEKEMANFKKNAEYSVAVEYDGNKARSSSDKNGSDSKQKFDWIERAIKKIQRAVTNLGKVVDATYKKWEERLGGVTGKYEKLQEEILLQQQAADAYMQEAYAVGLNPVYMDKVMNGLMDIETVTDEKLKEQISDFQELYDKANECEDQIEELKSEIAQLAQAKFDNITKQFEEMALAIDHAATRIGHIQSKMDSEGYFESSTLIEQLLFGDKEKLSQLEDEARQLAASIDEAVANGDIEYGSEQWWGMYDSLQNVNDQIVEMKSNMADLNDQLRQMEWDKFDYIQESVSRLTEENEFLIDILQDEAMMFEKNAEINGDMYANGNMSNAAIATQGLHVNSYQTLQEQAKDYAEEIEKINADLANDPNNKKLLERRNELIDQQRDIIKGISSEKQAIRDLIKQGYETFLDYLQKSIDKRKEALEAQKSLYDYERTIADQTKAISDYQKQIAALGGDDSEENRARMQQLSDNLKKAEQDLQQSEYERWLSDQEQMMDDMYSAFEKLIDDRLDNLDGLVERAVDQTAASGETIKQTIQQELDEFPYDLENTSFGINFDMKISDAVGAVDAVKAAIEAMHTAANINASNELNALSALAQTIVTQAQVQAQQAAQVNVNTNNNGGGSGSGGTNKNSVDPSGSTTNKIVGKSFDRSKDSTTNDRGKANANKTIPNKGNEADEALDMFNYYKRLAESVGQSNSMYYTYTALAADWYEKYKEALKKSKFAKGGTIGSAIKGTGEDGIILARTGEEVLSLERIKQMQSIFKMMQPLVTLPVNTLSNITSGTTVNGMNVSFSLPNVTSYEDFVNKAKKDPQFEKLVQNITIGTALGKSKLSKYS